MADLFITELDAITDFDDTDLVVIEKNPGGTPETNKMTIADVIAKYLLRNTYQISRTVASNNLTVAIKDSDGNNATAAKPLNFNINGTIRKLSGSLSVAVNAGVNTFNLGASEFLNLDQELFVYIGWRASDSSVFVLLSRMPDKQAYADFSATATSERYGAYSGSAPGATDALVNIGRVNVRNSGTASFNWSIPAGPITINRPIFETSWLSFVPTWGSSGTQPAIVSGTNVGKYRIRNQEVLARIRTTAAADTTFGTGTYTWVLPFTAATFTSASFSGIGRVVDTSVTTTYTGFANIASAGTTMNITTHAATGAVSGTVPVTLATTDTITMAIEYAMA